MDTAVVVFPETGLTLDEIVSCFVSSAIDAVVKARVLRLSREANAGYLVQIHPEDYIADGIFEDWDPSLVPTGTHSVFSLDYRDPGFAAEVIRALGRCGSVLVETGDGSIAPGHSVTAEFLKLR